MPEMSLSTPTRTTLPEISARATPDAASDKASAAQMVVAFMNSSVFRRVGKGPGRECVRGRAHHCIVYAIHRHCRAHDASGGGHGAKARLCPRYGPFMPPVIFTGRLSSPRSVLL